MGTYVPYFFPSICGSEHCRGGWDCHPDVVNPEVEGLAWKMALPECCHWSIHAAFVRTLAAAGGRPVVKLACRYGADCYRKSSEHLLNYSHASREFET